MHYVLGTKNSWDGMWERQTSKDHLNPNILDISISIIFLNLKENVTDSQWVETIPNESVEQKGKHSDVK